MLLALKDICGKYESVHICYYHEFFEQYCISLTVFSCLFLSLTSSKNSGGHGQG